MTWQYYALGSAVFAALVSIWAKIGLQGVDSNLATALRTVVILIFAWAMVFASGTHRQIAGLTPRSVFFLVLSETHRQIAEITPRGIFFLVLSGLATGASWLCYFRALQLGPASQVAPVDKLSAALTVVLAAIFLGEALTWRTVTGAALIVIGSLFLLKPADSPPKPQTEAVKSPIARP